MNIKDGGPAFPTVTGYKYYHGMSLRDYFAAKAMQGWIASYTQDTAFTTAAAAAVSEFAYAVADAMLARLEGKKE